MWLILVDAGHTAARSLTPHAADCKVRREQNQNKKRLPHLNSPARTQTRTRRMLSPRQRGTGCERRERTWISN